ncbi:chromate transport protein ChrA [Thalassobacillus pellis]|nr:chromate transport protein ChrA [Thalassobacillus pellis]
MVDRFGWMNVPEFSEMLAMANALPGPIATKMVGSASGGVGELSQVSSRLLLQP